MGVLDDNPLSDEIAKGIKEKLDKLGAPSSVVAGMTGEELVLMSLVSEAVKKIEQLAAELESAHIDWRNLERRVAVLEMAGVLREGEDDNRPKRHD